jgi:AraC-like DNA-binding protein
MSDENPIFENIRLFCDQRSAFRLDECDGFDGLDIETHFHIMYEVMWFRCAKGSFAINNQDFQIKNNTLIYIPALFIHDMRLERDERHRRFLLQFEEEWLEKLDINLKPDMRLKSLVTYLDDGEASRLDTLLGWAYDNKETDPHLHDALLRSFILFLIQKYKSNEYTDTKIIASTHAQLLISLVQNLDNKRDYAMSVSEAATGCGWSNSYFSRTFKGTFGVTFKEFILNRKLSLAVHLLTTTNFKISDIAYHAGFTDSAYFCLKFKQALSVSPKKFRANTTDTEDLVMDNCTGSPY